MTSENEICPICGEGHLEELVDKTPVEYKDNKTVLDTFYSVCDACGCEQANAAQTRHNKRLMIAFKKEVDGNLTGMEFKDIRKRLGITQNEAAAIFGGGSVAFSKYENDDVIPSESMDNLLYVADKLPAVLTILAKRKGIKLQSKPRLSIVAANSPQYKDELINSSDSKRQKIEILSNLSLINQSILRYGR
jgi:HTH-type transcriptional regulator/antitoxin MqsA